MKVRYPTMDFGNVRPHWSPNPEFAQSFNASSLIPSYVEPYLIKVMVKAKTALGSGKERLKGDIDVFIKQEIQHCKQHNAFNAMLRDAGYDKLKEFEKELAADLEGFLANKSLAFNCAYAEGFEAMGAASAQTLFENYASYIETADQRAFGLWMWHLAEEFEHRTVCAEVFETLVGRKNPIFGYFFRIYGFLYAVIHLRGFGNRVRRYLLAKDRETMTPEELAASITRERAVSRSTARYTGLRLLAVFSPFYNPGRKKTPPGLEAFLQRIEAGAT